MYNLHDELWKFYDRHVRLGSEEQEKLRTYRETNVDRLKKGLAELGYRMPIRTVGQGSYSMHTMVQHPNNDYDIDNALIFDKEDLPFNARSARMYVLAGILKGGGNFKQPPEARTNAVTIWYADGYHIDLPVYRCFSDLWGNHTIEHAGREWTPRDPAGINNWFEDQVNYQSPLQDNGATVKDKQMRRIVQLLKMFAKSHENWKLPGGLLISVLVSEQYRPDYNRDDISLYNTMNAIQCRLQLSNEVLNPVDTSRKLTDTLEHTNEVARFGEKLGKALEWLQPCLAPDCTKLDAVKAWSKVFDHFYWSDLVQGLEMQEGVKYIDTSTGALYINSGPDQTIESPPHRFYGD